MFADTVIPEILPTGVTTYDDYPAEVKDIAADGIQNVEGVEDTQTYIAMD